MFSLGYTNNSLISHTLKKLTIVLDQKLYKNNQEVFDLVFEKMRDYNTSDESSTYSSATHLKKFFFESIIPALNDYNYGHEDPEKFQEFAKRFFEKEEPVVKKSRVNEDLEATNRIDINKDVEPEVNNNFKDTTSTEPEKIDKQIKIEDTFKMPQSDENVKETETKLAGTREAKKQSTEILQNASVSINATTGSQEVKAIELPDVFKKPFTKFVEPSETANGPKSEILRKCEARLDRLYRKLKAKEARLESQNAQKESTEIIQTASVTTDASSTGSQETKAIETRMEQHIELPDVLKGPFTKSGEPSSTETANSQDWRTADLSKQPKKIRAMLEKEKLKKKQDLLKPAAIDSACINASSSSQEAFHTSKRGEIIVTQKQIGEALEKRKLWKKNNQPIASAPHPGRRFRSRVLTIEEFLADPVKDLTTPTKSH